MASLCPPGSAFPYIFLDLSAYRNAEGADLDELCRIVGQRELESYNFLAARAWDETVPRPPPLPHPSSPPRSPPHPHRPHPCLPHPATSAGGAPAATSPCFGCRVLAQRAAYAARLRAA